MQSSRIIKKYSNRRLYDMTTCSYITLEDVKKLVLKQIDFIVVDAKTNQDITQNTLLQIISEQETSATPLFTIPILRDFIRFYHEKSQNIFTKYLQQAMRNFIQQKEFLSQQWQMYEAFLQPTSAKKMKKSAKKSPSTSRRRKRS
ncbi:MAG: PhbF [uncultured bacterium]|nr:MAG: PhbF [uncultured bacterium]